MNFLPGELSGDELRLPIGVVRIPDSMRRRLEGGPGGGRSGVIVGLRPEHFEDASLVGDRSRGHTFRTKIDVLESMGSEYYAYFMVEAERVSTHELEELAQDAGAADLPSSRAGSQVVARLDAASRVRQGQEAELWFSTEHLQLFDGESGQSLLARNGAAAAGPAAPSGPAAPAGNAPAGAAPAGGAPAGGAPAGGAPAGGAPAGGAPA
jgi:multiple sugar transport system ATP-binding protein